MADSKCVKAPVAKIQIDTPYFTGEVEAVCLKKPLEVPQESTGFSPFELMYGRTVRDPMQILKELWTKDVDTPEMKNTFCRLGAKELSELKPQLDAKGVRLIGIGLEDLGLEDFQQGHFFDGELYVDTKKETYKLLGFKRFNFLSIFPAIFSKVSRAAYSKAKAEKVGGDLKGDGMQTGGTMVVEKGGKTLLTFKQDSPADHVDPAEVLKALGIDEPPPKSGGATAAGASCDGDVCAMPKKEEKPAPKCEGDVCEMPKKE
ncbi:prostamide/prostaglandin F synthase-like [Littorina saxatilis]|uniref:prostamide/prostaglandin F synthase-like n=1 Tax=Littorina saxatilis TaxID=31220 RepID=UPI0038B64EC8